MKRAGVNIVARRVMAALMLSTAPFVFIERAEAACDQTTTSATPLNNTVVNCSGATTNQNDPNGWGTRFETGDTINVQAGASVTGTSAGIWISDGTVKNLGAGSTIETTGPGSAVRAEQGALIVTNDVGGVIRANSGASLGIIALGGDLTLTNFGSVEATGVGGIGVITGGTATVTNNVDGTISGGAMGINAGTITVTGNAGTIEATRAVSASIPVVAAINASGDATVTNSKTIQAEGGGGIGINAGGKATVNNLTGGTIVGNAIGIQAATLDVANFAGATISGGIAGVTGSGSVDNVGNIIATDPSGVAVSGSVKQLFNRSGGNITGGSAGSGITTSADGALINNDGFAGSAHTATISGGLNGVLITGSDGLGAERRCGGQHRVGREQ